MIQYGKITEFRYTTLGSGKKLEVKVGVDDRVTNWLPVKNQASSFLVVHTPVRINDQVVVLNPFGNNQDGFVICGITQKNIPIPDEADEDTFIAQYNDGTMYVHNTKTKNISLETPCTIDIKTEDNINAICKELTVEAERAVIKSSSIDMGVGGTGVVTGECICPVLGIVHPTVSSTVRATK